MDGFNNFLEEGRSPEDWLDRSERARQHYIDQAILSPSSLPRFSRLPSEHLHPSIEHSDADISSPSPSNSHEQASISFQHASRRPNASFTYKREDSDGGRDLGSLGLSASQGSLPVDHTGESDEEMSDDSTSITNLGPPLRSAQVSSSGIVNLGSSSSENGAFNALPSSHAEYDSETPTLVDMCHAELSKKNAQASTGSTDEALSKKQAVLEIIDNGDGDDIMEIAPDHASTAAQRKWNQPREPTVLGNDDDVQFIKEEPKEHGSERAPTTPPAPVSFNRPKYSHDILNMLATQRAFVQTLRQSRKDAGVNCIGKRAHPEPEASGSTSLNPRKRVHEDANLEDEHIQMEAAMKDGEDHSWMHEEPEEDEEFGTLTQLYDTLVKRQKSGKILNTEMMELYRVQNRLQLLSRLRAASRREIPDNAADEEDDSLFIPENRDAVVDRHIRGRPQPRQDSAGSGDGEGMDGGDDMEGFGGEEWDQDMTFSRMLEQELNGPGLDRTGEGELTKAGKSKKKRSKLPKNAREAYARGEEIRLERERKKESKKAQKKKGRALTSAAPKKPAKGKGKVAKGGKKGKEAAKKGSVVTQSDSLLRAGRGKFNHWNGQDDVGQRILDDLMNNDPIAERLHNPIFNAPAEPEIHGRQVKATQLQRLFANIPEGSSKDSARGDKTKLQQASKSFGYAMVKAQDGKWLVKGMKSTLYHHQLLGAQWMVQRELSDDAPHGGLLADSMGLGKTVQTLACMVANPPMDADKRRKVKATLIVVPATVINQWIEEIRYHTSEQTFPKVVRYKTAHKLDASVLEDVDIVVTSYNDVMNQFPFPDKDGRGVIESIGYKKWWEDAIEGLGVLHQVNWYRVVLDEAHAIKNNAAKTSLACQNLKSVYRWCLTGTPLLNRLEELFPYLRFLKANYSMDWQTFQRYFCDPDADDCHNRIATLLSYTMMRRTMKTSILNRPIITLPKPHPFIRYVQFSPEEKIIYRITENRFRGNLNHFFRNGDAARNYGVFMLQLLRLRQCTSHPFMLERTIKEAWTLEDVEELRVRLSRLASADTLVPFYEQTKVWVEQSEAEREEARERGEAVGEGGEMLPFGQGDFGHKFEMNKALATLNEKELMARVLCGICADVPKPAKKTDCGHIFCEECIVTKMHRQLAEGDEYTTCPTCDKVYHEVKSIRGQDDDYPDPDGEGDSPTKSPPGRGKRQKKSDSKGIDMLGFEPKTKDSTWVSQSDHDDDFPLAPSAKTAALKATLLKGFDDAPLDKVVIYVQFRTLARIVGRICRSEDWGFVYLTGDTSLDHRTKAIKKFRDDPDVRILIAGLKCGGLGLNFTWANRCISLDLWWNHAVEQQAFGRIFRIGQAKETYLTRIVVKDSIDMRLLTMQVYKLETCERAIRDGEDKEKPNLSLRQLANLFGFLKTDEDNNILSVEPDYDDQDEWNAGGAGRMDNESF